MIEKVIIQLVGEAGAGKTEAAKHLAETQDFLPVRVSELIEEYALTRHLVLDKSSSREDYLAMHREMKKEHGNSVIVRTIFEKPSSRIVVDGIRIPNDMNRLKNIGTNVVSQVIALDCPFDIRLQRLRARNQSATSPTVEELQADDALDAYDPNPEFPNIRAILEAADHHIDASCSLTEVHQGVDRIVTELIS